MTLNDSIQGFRLRVLQEAERSGNVSATCRRYAVSRTVFYRWRARLQRYGPDGLHPTRRTARRGRAPELSVADERRVIAEALAWPTRGPQWVSDRLAQQGLVIAPVTVWRVLRRVGLNHRLARLAVLEDQSASTGLLTERTARRRPARHVAAAQPGDLCSLDSFYIGKLKGVGKVWQLTACDCAASYGWARIIVGEVTAAMMAAFLTDVVLPGYRQAGWRLRRVLTACYDQVVKALGAVGLSNRGTDTGSDSREPAQRALSGLIPEERRVPGGRTSSCLRREGLTTTVDMASSPAGAGASGLSTRRSIRPSRRGQHRTPCGV